MCDFNFESEYFFPSFSESFSEQTVTSIGNLLKGKAKLQLCISFLEEFFLCLVNEEC